MADLNPLSDEFRNNREEVLKQFRDNGVIGDVAWNHLDA